MSELRFGMFGAGFWAPYQLAAWNELAGAIFSALGREPRIEYIEMPEAIRDKYQYFTQAKIAKLRGAGYTQAITPLGKAVRDYVQNYLVTGSALGEAACESGRALGDQSRTYR